MQTRFISVREAAKKIGIPFSTARARCLEHGIGRIVGKTRVLTAKDAARLKAIKPGKVGRPRKEPA